MSEPATVTIDVSRYPDPLYKIRPDHWPAHIAIHNGLLNDARMHDVLTFGDGFVRFTLANGTALYGIAHEYPDASVDANHYDLISEGP